ncbi:Arachidonate 5-lipoxygenase [Triplophysa tibetana]|uniref:Arachidonate 5-lipoxygenase n=1 Tax=Triplophysa tibetana TaxID=1572043 RepID=A0A5A9NGA8_9TELE|nr:Arachidonate 5-lipoxygenase [Triplophysa tibetana]
MFLQEITTYINVEKDFGDIVQVKLEKYDAPWFCRYIQVKSPYGKSFEFPCYRWLEKEEVVIREGSATLPQDDNDVLKKQRQEELQCRQTKFRWIQERKGFPQSLDDKPDGLPRDVRRVLETIDTFSSYFQSWDEMADFEKILTDYDIKKTLLVHVMEDWYTDYMFGYQFLNGCNPDMISKCVNLPEKFPVTHEMVKGSLQRGLTLHEELKEGNIYIADYEILDELEANKHQNTQYYLTAPICLLYNNRLNQIVPIAIQLRQKPEERSPIFLPSDNEHDWMLAKMWVKSSDFNVHQLVTHLLKTHLISEVFEVAMYRQLSTVHPVYKLLVPHVRFTIAINSVAREKLISKDGVFSKISSISGKGINDLMEKARNTCTFKSMCFPEAIHARGMENTPKYYYRDDGMKIWDAINGFVDQVIKIYYESDETVQKDVEIQEFVKDVSVYGMLDSDGKKFPQSLNTREELIEYLTAIIFNASAQHAAVNFGQFEYYGWIPNSPSTMRKPPPQEKDSVDLNFIMDTLPDRGCSRDLVGIAWDLTRFQGKEV